MGRKLGFLAILLAGCAQEYTLDGWKDPNGVPNPPELLTPEKTDRITQVTTPVVDVLWVIDDSTSMLDEQRKLTRNITAFMDFFVDSGLDWHVGVITVDVVRPAYSGKLRSARGVTFIDRDTPDPIGTFEEMASVGIYGAGNESGLRASYLALTDPLLNGFNAGFYRDDAQLNIIVISDEDDYSGNDPDPNEYIDFLTTMKSDPDKVRFSGIIGPGGGACGAVETGARYIAVSDAVGGIVAPICTSDWVPLLESLGLQAAGARSEFFLSEVPVPGSLQVVVIESDRVVGGVDLDTLPNNQPVATACDADACFGYTYDPIRNSLLFDRFYPAAGATVEITYELLAAQQTGAE